MKNYFLLVHILCGCLFVSCSEKKQKPPVASMAVSGGQIDSVRRENLKSPYDSTIVLGFRFGMTKQEYDYTYSRLIRADTLHKFRKTVYWMNCKN